MKIITNNEVYVQKNDLAYLYHSDLPLPSFIHDKILENIRGVVNDGNRYDFVKFKDEASIEYFKSLDWMTDYTDVKDNSEEELNKLLESIAEEHEAIAQVFNAMPDEERLKNMEMYNKANFLEFKFYSLRDIMLFKQGNLSMKLPKKIDNSKASVSKKTLTNKETEKR